MYGTTPVSYAGTPTPYAHDYVSLICQGCGNEAGRVNVAARDQQSLRRILAFFAAFRCGPCWVARQQDRQLGRGWGVRIQTDPQPPVRYNPDGTEAQDPRDTATYPAPRTQNRVRDSQGRLWQQVSPNFGG